MIHQGFGIENRIQGPVGRALQFTAEFQTISIQSTQLFSTRFTVCSWVLPTANLTVFEQAATYDSLLGTRYLFEPINAGDIGIAVGINGMNVVFNEGLGFSILLSWNNTLASTSWTHFCVAFDSGIPTLFLNGRPVQQGVAPSLSLLATFSISNIGGLNQFYQGGLDNVNVFATSLTTTSIQQLYQTERSSSPVADYHFDEGNGNVTTDSRSGSVASISNAQESTWIVGAIGPGALSLAASQVVAFANTLQVTGLSSVSFWVQPADQIVLPSQGSLSSLTGQRLVWGLESSSLPDSVIVSVGTNGVAIFTCTSGSCLNVISWTGSLSSSSWSFVALVLTPQLAKLYVCLVRRCFSFDATRLMARSLPVARFHRRVPCKFQDLAILSTRNRATLEASMSLLFTLDRFLPLRFLALSSLALRLV